MASMSNVLDPQRPLIQKWNKFFIITCVMAISVDPLFFYIPMINGQRKCIDFDGALKVTACVLRTFLDVFYILRIIFQFRTGFIAPTRVFGRGELVDDSMAIVKRYLSSNFIIDILSIIPLPQMATLAIIRIPKFSVSYVAKDLLKYTVIAQYVPRLLRIYPLFKEIKSNFGTLTETVWAGAVFNLFLYMLASHVIGAFWYLLSVESEVQCWRRQLKNTSFYHDYFLSCGLVDNPTVLSLLNRPTSCPHKDPDDPTDPTVFNFGMFMEALKFGVVESTTNFRQKFFYSFWWGLRNVSSAGQNLQTSTHVGEIIFAIFISISGLVLFSLLIGNVQKYLRSTTLTSTVRVEEMRFKKMDTEHWMSRRLLPLELKERIRQYEQYIWKENRGVEEETLIRHLPKDLRRDIKRHLCLGVLLRVPMFEIMDERLMDEMCERMKPVLHTRYTYIVREGDPVDEMLFFIHGNLESVTTNGVRSGFFNRSIIKAGNVYGEELLTWALDPNTLTLPISTKTVKTISEVEAFALMADDLKFAASQFRRLLNSEQLQHAFRFYSQQWRTWAAYFIQAVWRRYWKKKTERSQCEAEDMMHALPNEDGSSSSFGATEQASRFESNVLRPLRSGKCNIMPQTRILLPLLPKPAEPDFTTEEKNRGAVTLRKNYN